MISTLAGSSSQLVIASIAVRRLPMLRDAASGLTKTDPIVVPEVCAAWCGQKAGTIKSTGFGKFNN
jgi:hypothetical protein